MKKETKRRIAIFFIGLALVTFMTIIGTLAFFEAKVLYFIRNVAFTDVVFVALYALWIRLNRGYEAMYKSGLDLEEKRQ